MDVKRSEFELLVRQAVEGLPEQIRSKLANTLFVIEPDGDLLGLYQGTPYPDRGEGPPILPDRITLFQRPIEEAGGTRAGIVREIRTTIIHEVGHFLGLDDEDLENMGMG